jgi:hypothetical protein
VTPYGLARPTSRSYARRSPANIGGSSAWSRSVIASGIGAHTRAASYRNRMPPRPSGRQLGLFDNPVRAFSLEELAEAVRELERQRPGQTVDEISSAVFAELAMKRTRRASDLVTEAIRIARQREPRAEITGTPWQASTSEIREWAASNGFQIGTEGTIPGPAITAYNQDTPRPAVLNHNPSHSKCRHPARKAASGTYLVTIPQPIVLLCCSG